MIKHSELPAIKDACLYEAAALALSQCSKIDECKDWSDRAKAMASYAKQADNEEMENLAKKIRLRAYQRVGQLLREIEKAQNQHDAKARTGPTRKQAAKDAGLSDKKAKTAIRLSRIPKDEFDELVDSGDPPLLKKWQRRGRRNANPYMKNWACPFLNSGLELTSPEELGAMSLCLNLTLSMT